jgi:hypothetical protein
MDPNSGSGSTQVIESGSNTDPDPQPWFLQVKHHEKFSVKYAIQSHTKCIKNFFHFTQCFGSGSAWIRIQLVAWIRIRIRNADPDPDPGGLKRAKMKKKTQQKAR